MFVRVLITFVACISVVSCNTARTSPSETASPLQPSAILEPTSSPRAALSGGAMVRAAGNVNVNIHDNCDPETFNAAIEPGACGGPGGMQFDEFISLLTRFHMVPSWRFDPGIVNAHRGERFVVVNKGGEVHTFTEVEKFGGGIVPNLNQLAGLTTVAPECQGLAPSAFIAPGGTFEDEIEHDEAEHYQCCIHPWMRLTTRVK